MTKTEKITGIVLAMLLLLLTLSGSGYFFFTLKVNFVQWRVYNACSPSSLVYLVGFIVFLYNKNSTWLLPSYRCTILEPWDSLPLHGVELISLRNYHISL